MSDIDYENMTLAECMQAYRTVEQTPCSKCGARPSESCWMRASRWSHPTTTHVARYRAAGYDRTALDTARARLGRAEWERRKAEVREAEGAEPEVEAQPVEHDAEDVELPPKPYENWLSGVLTSAMGRTVTVRGRVAYIEPAEGQEKGMRGLIPEAVLDQAVGETRGGPWPDFQVTILRYDEAAAAEPFDDGTVWHGDGACGPHWCLAPEACDRTTREQAEG